MTPAPGPERRLNLLTGDWVLVSPQRLVRPWQGETTAVAPPSAASHDPHCYLCAGNPRVGGACNPDYAGVYVFDNDFPALLRETGADAPADPLLVREPQTGVCRVICYTPNHGRTMAKMSVAEIAAVVDAWAAQTTELSRLPDIAAVNVFENRGEMMGASNPHPHGQIWATSSVPNELAREAARQSEAFEASGRPLLMAYLERERAAGERVVLETDGFTVLVPFWAAWPFETLVLPHRPISTLVEAGTGERRALAEALARVTRLYDRLFDTPFPYTMGLHQAPKGDSSVRSFVFHMHFYPPLLRSASIRKFMVGFEMLAMPQRDLTPEAAAARLKALAKADA